MMPLSPIFLDPPPELPERILRSIMRLETRRRWRKFWLSLAAFSLSLVGLRIVFVWVVQDLGRSGFAEFLSLAFVDLSVITESGQEFVLALLESVPALSMSLGGILLVIGTLSGWSLFNFGRNSFRVRHLSH